jgi:hypothetical protein
MKLMPNLKRRAGAVLLAASLAVACTAVTPPTASTTLSASATTSETSASTTGDGVNDAYACDTDAHLYCAGFYGADWQNYARANGYTTASWKYGLLDCLGKHAVSQACQASLDRRQLLNTQMMNACASYCRGTTPQPGAEPCVDHLKAIYASLDTACRAALDAHEAAKPIAR